MRILLEQFWAITDFRVDDVLESVVRVDWIVAEVEGLKKKELKTILNFK
jgi:hypothetical protein